MKKLFVFGAAFLSAAVLFAAGQVSLIKDGKANSVIVIENDNVSTKKAGEELQKMMEQRTGAKVAVISAEEKVPAGMIPIYLGLSDRTRKLGADDKKIKYDGYFFKATPEYVVIAGRDNPQTDEAISGHTFIVCNYKLNYYVFGEKGTVNGVYKILEKYAGNRHYMPGKLGEIVPKSPDFTLPVSQHTDAPAFRERYFYGVWFRDGNPDFLRWYYQMCCGGQNNSINHSYNVMHRKYKNTNPEYFALIGGKRDLKGLSTANLFGNLCMTNKEGIKAFAKIAQDFFNKHPNYTTYAVVPQDGLFKICECPDCQKLASPHLGQNGRFSNAVFHHAAEIAKIVGKTHPDKMIGTLAYAGYRVPPEMDLPPNLAVRICYQRQALRDPARKKEIEDAIKGYAKKNVPVLVWTYALFNRRPPMRGIPVFYPNILQQNIKFNRDNGVIGEFSESTYRSGDGDQYVKQRAQFAFPGFTHINDYVRSQLLWNPDLDLNAMMDEYYKLFYGPAEKEMRLFWETAEKLFLKNGAATAYSLEELALFMEMLKNAEKKAPADTVYGQRIRLIHTEMTPFIETMIRLRDKSKYLGVAVVKDEIPADFSLTDKAWRHARVSMLNYKDGRTDVPRKNQTFLYSVANEKGLGLHVLCKEPDPSKLRANFMIRDDRENIWRDDCLELFLITADRKENRHYIINAGGNIADGLRTVDIHTSDWDWSTKMKLKIKKGKSEYSYTMVIPWEDLNLKFSDLPELRFQLIRRQTLGNPRSGTYYMAFPSTGFHNYSPEYFGPVKFMSDENRIFNGKFEKLDSKGKLSGWIGNNTPAFKEGAEGKYCAKICGTKKANETIYSSRIPVLENTDFELNFRYVGAASYAYFLFYDKNNKRVVYGNDRPEWLDGKKNWTYKSFQGRVPAKAVNLVIAFRNFDGGTVGGAWFDSVELRGGAKYMKPAAGFNNGSFEDFNKNGNISGWSKPFNLEKSGVLHGKHAIRVAKGNHDWMISDKFIVRGGTEYKMILNHRGDAGFVYFFFYNGNGKQIGNAKYHWIAEKKNWAESVFTGTIPAEAVKCAIGLRNFTATKAEKGAWFDNLAFYTE